jgi:hypothetical protein
MIGLKINEWLEMDEASALSSIEEFVGNSTTENIDQMDAALLNRVNITFDADDRKSVVKYYAYFKLGEYVKFNGKWRGFPQ